MASNEPNTILTTPNGNLAGAWPRYLNAAVGAWLFLSAFVWAHSDSEFTNAWIVGALMLLAALAALAAPAVRYANTALAVWLFASTLVIGGANVTVWNHIIVAIVAFIVSWVPNQMSNQGTPAAHHPA